MGESEVKKVLVFGITSLDPPYPDLLRASLDTWESVPVEGVETFFYHGGTNPSHYSHPKVVGFVVQELLLNMGYKNLSAFPWALKRDWDYMARVNASCYVRKQKLLAHCQTLPESGVFQGGPLRERRRDKIVFVGRGSVRDFEGRG